MGLRLSLMVMLLLMPLLAACAQTAPPTATPIPPTATIIVTPEATPTPLQRPTLPPTWTPVSRSEPEATPTDGANAALPVDAEPPTLNPVLIPPTPLEVCNNFSEDFERNRRTFTPGEPATVYWTAVEGAASYYIALLDDLGLVAIDDYTLEPTYTFMPEVFEPGKLYGWQVYPIDRLGQQMCLARGAELFPDRPF